MKGDITPTYSAMFDYEVSLVKELVPDMKIIFVIRNPVDRMISQITRQWTYSHIDKGASTTRNLPALLRQVDSNLSRRLNDFASSYEVWHRHFGSDKVLVMNYDNLAHDPHTFIQEIESFLNIDRQDLLASTAQNKANKSSCKDEVPDFLSWYLAVEWLPMVQKINCIIDDVRLEDWIQSMTVTSSQFKIHWLLIKWFHKIYFCLPYNFLFGIFNFFRSVIRKRSNLSTIQNYYSRSS